MAFPGFAVLKFPIFSKMRSFMSSSLVSTAIKKEFKRSSWRLIISCSALFVSIFAFWTLVKRSGAKPIAWAPISAALKSGISSSPPNDKAPSVANLLAFAMFLAKAGNAVSIARPKCPSLNCFNAFGNVSKASPAVGPSIPIKYAWAVATSSPLLLGSLNHIPFKLIRSATLIPVAVDIAPLAIESPTAPPNVSTAQSKGASFSSSSAHI